jgi:ferric-dicitrate binding protein FerR (iron transport regulator)
MSEQDQWEREFDHRWADAAGHKEPSARARMLAARWKDAPPRPVPFRADPEPVTPRRSSWVSTAVVLGCIAAVILLIGYTEVHGLY